MSVHVEDRQKLDEITRPFSDPSILKLHNKCQAHNLQIIVAFGFTAMSYFSNRNTWL